MADTAAPASTPAASDPGAGAASAPATAAPAATHAPEWVPADFSADWGTDGYAEKVSRGYADKHAKLSTRTDDLRKQVAAEIEADRRRGLPDKPDGYVFTLDGLQSKYASDLFAEHKIRLVDEIPADGISPTDEHLYAPSKDSDAGGWWREFCHKHGLPVEAYHEGIARIILRDVRKVADTVAARKKQFAEQDAAELKLLGAAGGQRKDGAIKGLGELVTKLLGPEKGALAAASLGEAMHTAASIEAVEQILKMTAGGLSPGVGGQSAAAPRPADVMFPGLARK